MKISENKARKSEIVAWVVLGFMFCLALFFGYQLHLQIEADKNAPTNTSYFRCTHEGGVSLDLNNSTIDLKCQKLMK